MSTWCFPIGYPIHWLRSLPSTLDPVWQDENWRDSCALRSSYVCSELCASVITRIVSNPSSESRGLVIPWECLVFIVVCCYSSWTWRSCAVLVVRERSFWIFQVSPLQASWYSVSNLHRYIRSWYRLTGHMLWWACAWLSRILPWWSWCETVQPVSSLSR